jgi:hypothetical protein
VTVKIINLSLLEDDSIGWYVQSLLGIVFFESDNHGSVMKGICNEETRQSEIIDMFYAMRSFGNVKRERLFRNGCRVEYVNLFPTYDGNRHTAVYILTMLL